MIGNKKVVGFVAEFNPFHDGHKYFINKIKENFPESIIVCVMSAYFVQRGEPAIFDPYIRANDAIKAGVDLILGLPTCASLSSAENFAKYSVGLINSLNFVDYLAFGVNNISIDELKEYNMKREDTEVLIKVKTLIREGKTYGAALEEATGMSIREDNVLAAEYLRALDNMPTTIVPYAINKDESLSSASKIREEIYSKYCDENLIPIKQVEGYGYPVTSECFSEYITAGCVDALYKYKVDNDLPDGFRDFDDINPKLFKKILNTCIFKMPFSEMVSTLKTKNWTASYIKRALFKITLRIVKAITSTLEYERYSEYYFVIGYSDEGKKLIKHLAKPVSINFTFTNMNNTEANMFSTIVYTSDCYSHSVYASVFFGKNNKTVI